MQKKEPESNVLLASVENMQYEVTLDVLHTVSPETGLVALSLVFCAGLCIFDCALMDHCTSVPKGCEN
jgi:hypothetical protein